MLCVAASSRALRTQVMYYQMLVLAFLAAKAFQNVFFGQLRFAELEVGTCARVLDRRVRSGLSLIAVSSQRVYEKSWFAVTETCLAMTIFRDEFNAVFVAQFVLLLAVKMFHWLAQDRVCHKFGCVSFSSLSYLVSNLDRWTTWSKLPTYPRHSMFGWLLSQASSLRLIVSWCSRQQPSY